MAVSVDNKLVTGASIKKLKEYVDSKLEQAAPLTASDLQNGNVAYIKTGYVTTGSITKDDDTGELLICGGEGYGHGGLIALRGIHRTINGVEQSDRGSVFLESRDNNGEYENSVLLNADGLSLGSGLFHGKASNAVNADNATHAERSSTCGVADIAWEQRSAYARIGDYGDGSAETGDLQTQGSIDLKTSVSASWWHIDNFSGNLRLVNFNNARTTIPFEIVKNDVGIFSGSIKANIPIQSYARPNLLDNPFFQVNQSMNGGGAGWGSDRWYTDSNWQYYGSHVDYVGMTYQQASDEMIRPLLGKTVTASARFTDGSVHWNTFNIPTSFPESGYIGLTPTRGNAGSTIQFILTKGSSQWFRATSLYNCVCVKLEIGEYPTIEYEVPPSYDAELAKCQYYFQKYSTISCFVTYPAQANKYYGSFTFPHPMRTSPTVYLNGVGDGRLGDFPNVAWINNSALEQTWSDNASVTFVLDGTETGSRRGMVLRIYNVTLDARF